MKRVSYIIFGIAFLALASCQKEIIAPTNPADETTSVEWKSTDISTGKTETKGSRGDLNDKMFGEEGTVDDSGGDQEDSGEGSGITDPNNDPDAAKKKGKK